MIKLVKPFLTVFMLGAVVFISSCDKDDEPKPKTKTELLTAQNWKVVKLKVDGQEGQPEDCYGDNVYTFETDGDFRMQENTKCDPADPSSITGTWQFKSNEAVLSISQSLGGGASFTIDQQILELTETTFKVSYEFFGIAIEETYGPAN